MLEEGDYGGGGRWGGGPDYGGHVDEGCHREGEGHAYELWFGGELGIGVDGGMERGRAYVEGWEWGVAAALGVVVDLGLADVWE